MSAVRAAACAGRTALALDASSPLRLPLARPSACPACRWTQQHAAPAARRQGFHVLSASCAVSKFRMPTMSPTMTEGGIMNWRKAEGEAFSAGDILLEIETDKAQIEVEAQDDGILAKILAPAGTGKKVAVNDPIAIIAEDESDMAQANSVAVADESREPAESKPAAADNKMAEAGLQPKLKTAAAGRTAHTVPTGASARFPAVARLLAEYGVDVSAVRASGPKGNVLKGDVLKFIKEGNLVKKPQVGKNVRPQKGQTSRASFAMPKTKSTLPRFVVTHDVMVPAARDDDPNAALIYAVSRAVRSVPQLNIRRVRNPSFFEDEIEDTLAASEFVAELGTEATADVDVMFRKDTLAGALDGVLFRNADRAAANAKEPITMDFLGQYKKMDAVNAGCAVGITPSSSGVYDFSLSTTAVEPTIVNIARSRAVQTSLPSSADIFDILSTRPRLPSGPISPRFRADEIDMLFKHSPISKAAPAAAVPKYTLSFSFDATLIDPVVADEFCNVVAQELAGRT